MLRTIFGTCVAIVALVACTSGSSSSPGTNACNNIGLSSRVANGTQCETQESPVVELTVLPAEGGVSLCSGSLITIQHILTAAHCFDFEDGVTSISARIGSRSVPVKGVVIHPAANLSTIPPQNDVAIATLVKPAQIGPLPLILSRGIEPGDIVGIYGFGLDDDDISGVLRSGEMEIAGINSQFFTAVFEDERGSQVCQGDSGGPSTIRTDNGSGVTGIVGVTSFGSQSQAKGCGSDGSSAFMNIQSPEILSFITNNAPGVSVQ